MKNVDIRLLSLTFLLLLAFTTAFAQKSYTEKAVIIQKTENADGSVTTVKKIIENKGELKEYLQQLGEIQAKDVDLHFVTEDSEGDDLTEDDMLFYFRKATYKNNGADAELDALKLYMADDFTSIQLDEAPRAEKEKVTRPLLGVYADESSNGNGLLLTGVVKGKGSDVAGLQSGDVVTDIDGQSINNIYDLRNILNQRQPGESVKVTYQRAGESMTTDVVLSETTTWQKKRNPCKVFIGVQLGGHNFSGRGVNVDRIIPGWPADKAGIKAGDVIVALDDVEVNNHHDLLVERNKHNAGEYFTLSVLRAGVEIDIDAQFLPCPEETTAVGAAAAPEVINQIPDDIPTTVENSPLDEEIDGALKLEAYRAFPNPTYGMIRLQFIAEEGPTTVRIVDVSGKVIYKDVMNHFDGYYNKEVDIKDGTPGTVVLQIQQADKVVNKKLILMPRA
jgi:C-terminal processing protease CtpA/Prc